MAEPTLTRVMAEVLSLLLQAWEDKTDVYGWAIMKSVRRSGPVVYGVLDRLEDAGWINASWEVLPEGQDRPRRRYYHLTALGAEAARLHAAAPESPRRGVLRPQHGFSLVKQPSPAP